MRKLLVLRGAPGVGKTLWTNENRLLIYTLSYDNIRMLYQSPIQTIYGKEAISPKKNQTADEALISILEERMKSGEFTVIDGINSKSKTIAIYQALAVKYRYQMYIIDFTQVPIKTAKYWNIHRSRRKQVREGIIDEIYKDFENEKLPHNLNIIKPSELNKVYEAPIDLSGYKKVHHIGDVHGCYNVLSGAIKANGNLRDDEFYIFLGDYTDKGTKNLDVMKFLLSIKNNHNVVFCEGNHERWMWNWANEINEYTPEFEERTLPQISSLNKKDVRRLYRNMKECYWYKFYDKNVINTHGGIATLPEHIDYISTEQLIHGVGFYSDLPCIANTFANTTTKNTYQVFGHRNPDLLEVNPGNRTFYLEGAVDSGGHLRWLTLNKDGFHEKEYENLFGASSHGCGMSRAILSRA